MCRKMRNIIQYPNKSINFYVCEQKMSNDHQPLVYATISEKISYFFMFKIRYVQKKFSKVMSVCVSHSFQGPALGPPQGLPGSTLVARILVYRASLALINYTNTSQEGTNYLLKETTHYLPSTTQKYILILFSTSENAVHTQFTLFRNMISQSLVSSM